jgi:hypothetical protein
LEPLEFALLVPVPWRCPLAASVTERPFDDLKLVIVRSDGTVNVQAIVERNVYAEPIERSIAKRPL